MIQLILCLSLHWLNLSIFELIICISPVRN